MGLGAKTSLILSLVVLSLRARRFSAPPWSAWSEKRRPGWDGARLEYRFAGARDLPRAPARGGATVATITAALAIAVTLAFWSRASSPRCSAGFTSTSPPIFWSAAARGCDPGRTSDQPWSETRSRVFRESRGGAFRIVSIRLRGRPAFLQGVSVADRLARGDCRWSRATSPTPRRRSKTAAEIC